MILSFEKNDAPFGNLPVAALTHGCSIIVHVISV